MFCYFLLRSTIIDSHVVCYYIQRILILCRYQFSCGQLYLTCKLSQILDLTNILQLIARILISYRMGLSQVRIKANSKARWIWINLIFCLWYETGIRSTHNWFSIHYTYRTIKLSVGGKRSFKSVWWFVRLFRVLSTGEVFFSLSLLRYVDIIYLNWVENMKLLFICILLLPHSFIFFKFYFFINVYMVSFLFNP